MPMKNKVTSLAKKAFRKLHNTKEDVDENIKVGMMNKFMKSLKASRNNHAERFKILQEGFKTFENLKEKEKKDKHLFYRPSNFEKDKRKKEKEMNKYSWFQKANKFRAVMF